MKKIRVLFLGNSHTFFNDMPQIFKNLAAAGQQADAEVTMQAHPGVTFEWHLAQQAELRFALMYGNYDYMVMQQAAHEPCPAPDETIRDGKAIIEHARACHVTPILCMPWAEKRFPEHQAIMFDTYTSLAKETGVRFDVTGYVFDRVRQDYPDINLYFYDGEHCNAYGSYVRAMAAYAVIFDKSPEGLPAESIQHYIMNPSIGEAYPAIQAALDETPTDDDLRLEAQAFWSACKANWNSEACKVKLDPGQAAILQKLVWEYTEKYR